ncbi:nitric oxide synthase-interacting protein-like [Littorina saxatilis]|uniref:Nitric oxide synthase-interacting protein zinc-finger domain-containing protein n=1 Tax=Littorina saxatilis TaxID=31220 RepID=A0AAN9B5L5_9CAEN
MTRHARNCTAGTVYTYHERKKDTKMSGYGTQKLRVGKDSVKDFDCCCLTLQPCKNPVVTPQGYLFDKEAILEYILHQKREIARKLKEFEKQKHKVEDEMKELAAAEQRTRTSNFVQQETNPINSKHEADKTAASTSAGPSLNNMAGTESKNLPSFWIPSLTPAAAPTQVKKPDEKVRCPMTGQVLKMKDLIDVKFTPINDRDTKTSLISKTARYVCAVTNDVLGNSVPAAVLKTSGKVVTIECLEKIIKKDMVDPTNNKKLTEKDIIHLNRGATGFASTGAKMTVAKAGPSLMA